MDPVIKAGISGFVIALVIIFFLPVNTYFLGYIVASVIAIYAFGLKKTKDGMLVAFTIYLFAEWILGSLGSAALFASNETLIFTVDIWTVLNRIVTTLFILLGGLLGSELAKKKRAPMSAPPLPPPPPPTPTSPPIMPAPVYPQSVPATAISEKKKFCRYCGAENHDDAIFCEKCGKKIG